MNTLMKRAIQMDIEGIQSAIARNKRSLDRNSIMLQEKQLSKKQNPTKKENSAIENLKQYQQELNK